MSNNYWQSQNDPNGSPKPENVGRKSGLLSNYGNQTQQPANNPVPQGPSPISPLPPAGRSSQQLPPPQQRNGPSFMARPAQIVQRWSAKMAAMRRPAQPVEPGPLVRYRPPQPPDSPATRRLPVRPTPWRRSRTQRIAHLRRVRRERYMRNGPGSKRLRTIVLSSIAAVLLILISSTAVTAFNFYQSTLPQLQALANQRIPQSTHIYDRNGNLLYTLYANSTWGEGGRSTPISYNYLPGVLQDAQIAAEDPTFWTNNGTDPQGMLRALTQYLSHPGEITSGGSTMTQQLIKNLSGNAQDTFQRKASEAALAIGLTQQYPKWKIMEMYFNDTPYGSQEKGVEAAVEDYFGIKPMCTADFKCTPAVAFLDRDLSKCKNPKDESTCAVDPILGLARAAMLAGIPQNPTNFDLTTNLQNLLTNRLPYVLDQMVADKMSINLGLGSQTNNQGPITKDIEAQVEAKAATIKIVGFNHTKLAPHFVDWVITTLADALGHGTDAASYNAGLTILENSGLNIYTTLDLNLEQFVEKDIKHNLHDRVYQEFLGTYGPLDTEYNLHNSAAVVINAKTGEVLAMDGSVDYNDNSPQVQGQYNAALALRQPGSSFKPIVYATAFEHGWYPAMRVFDQKTYFPAGYPQTDPVSKYTTYLPTDYGQTYHDVDETARIDLANSFNIPAIKALQYAGFDDVVNTARRFGITDIDEDLAIYNAAHPKGTNTLSQNFGLSLALGTAGISLLQMTDAYQTFADNGVHVPAHNILDIWDNYGHNLYHYDPTHPNGSQVISPEVAFLMNNVLSDNPARDKYEFQGITTLTMGPWAPNRPVAAKTGTTDGPLDNWTEGFSSSIVVGVWSGNSDGNDPMKGIIGVTGAGNIWHDIITYASGNCQLGMCPDKAYPTDAFSQPNGVVYAPVNTYNGLQGNGTMDWMINGEQPQQAGLPPTSPCSTNGNGNGWGNGHGHGGNNNNCPPGGTNGNGGQNGNSDSNGTSGGTPGWPDDPFGN